MGTNKYTGQLVGPFKANEELYAKIQDAAMKEIKLFRHLGIQAEPETIVIIDGKEFEIGITGIYEIEQTNLLSLYFKSDIRRAIIDYVIEI